MTFYAIACDQWHVMLQSFALITFILPRLCHMTSNLIVCDWFRAILKRFKHHNSPRHVLSGFVHEKQHPVRCGTHANKIYIKIVWKLGFNTGPVFRSIVLLVVKTKRNNPSCVQCNCTIHIHKNEISSTKRCHVAKGFCIFLMPRLYTNTG